MKNSSCMDTKKLFKVAIDDIMRMLTDLQCNGTAAVTARCGLCGHVTFDLNI